MRGVFPILLTPFDEHDRIDEDGLRSVVEYAIRSGVHGVGIALGSEMPKLVESERELVVRTVIDQARGRLPVVVNTGAPANYPAVVYSQQAEAQGASAVMCIAPAAASASEIRSYFKAISDAVSVPIFIQDVATASVSAGLIRQMADESEWVRYAKIESPPQPVKVADAVAKNQGLVTIFGGASGTFLIEELRRGSVGTMPFPTQLPAFVAVWDRFQAGDLDGARGVFDREILPLLRVSSTGVRLGHLVHKEVLRRQGVIKCAKVRAPADPLDAQTKRELDEVLDLLGIG
jgi:dihydrodipicolinate synthase/N-acetylneuraminate lyase